MTVQSPRRSRDYVCALVSLVTGIGMDGTASGIGIVI